MKRRINKIQDETKKEDVYQKMLRGRSYFAEYSLSEKGELVLADANREYLSANGYTAEQIGQCIAAFAPPAFQAQLQSYLRKNGSYVFWEECRSGMRKVRVGVENGRVTMTGHYMLPDENKAYAGVGCGEQGHYYIFDLNDSFTELLKGERLVFRSLTSSSCFCRAMITLSACKEDFSCRVGMHLYEYRMETIPVMKKGKLLFMAVLLEACGDKNMLSVLDTLTGREKQILRLTANGCTNKYIAYCLHIKEGTVKNNLYHCYRKLSVSSRAEVIRLFGE